MRLQMWVCLLAVAVCGCASANSTLVTWDQWDSKWNTRKSKGYPITLKVPTHIRVDVLERRYFQSAKSTATDANAISAPILVDGELLTKRDVQTQIVYTSKMFTVDLNRPGGAGEMNYGIGFTNDQYVHEIQSQIADDTIGQSSQAFVEVLGALTGGAQTSVTAAAGINLNGSSVPTITDPTNQTPRPDEGPIKRAGEQPWLKDFNIIERPSVVASGTFDLEAPDLYDQVSLFLHSHLER